METSLNPDAVEPPNFGKVCTRKSICLSGGLSFEVKGDQRTTFWEDSWVRDIPLKFIYPDLYAAVINKPLYQTCWMGRIGI